MIEDIQTPVKDKLISFFHIPKTAGTNFTFLIKNNYPLDKYKIDDSKFHAVDKSTNKVVCSWGHGGHQNSLNEDSVMFVFLRDPVERVISHYVEHKNNRYMAPDFTLEEMFIQKPDIYLSKESPDDIIRKRGGLYNSNWGRNFYCRALSGYGYLTKEPWYPDEDTKNSIISNMKRNEVVLKNKNGKDIHIPTVFGITENFTDSIKMFANIAGWNTVHYEEKSKNRAYNGGKRRYQASDKLVEEITKHNTYDIEIYEEAKKIFEKELVHFRIK